MLKVNIEKTLNHFKLSAAFEVGRGITGIIGPSGCGKSVTLQCIAGLQTPDHGKIQLNDSMFYQSSNRTNIKPRHRNVGYVFQNYALFPHLTVEKNIEFGLKSHPKQDKQQRVASMIKKVHLSGYEKHYPNQLSGGQQQRVALARTLITEPSLLLLDEPFSALDHHVKHLLEQELLSIIKENYSGIVMLVTHNMDEAYRLCDQLILLNNGHIIQSGKKEDVFKKPNNVSAAKVIGCKNIIPVDSIKETNNYLECTIQGTMVKVQKQQVTQSSTHLGIYPENIHFVVEPEHTDYTYNYQLLEVVTGIHQTNVTIKVEDSFTLNVAIPNHQLQSLLQGTYKVQLSPEHLFILENR